MGNKEEFLIKYEFDNGFVYKWRNQIFGTVKWEKAAYRLVKKTYKKMIDEKYVYHAFDKDNSGYYEYTDKLEYLSTKTKDIVLFKNDKVELDPKKVEDILRKKMVSYVFSSYETTLFGRVLDDSSIDWNVGIGWHTDKCPF